MVHKDKVGETQPSVQVLHYYRPLVGEVGDSVVLLRLSQVEVGVVVPHRQVVQDLPPPFREETLPVIIQIGFNLVVREVWVLPEKMVEVQNSGVREEVVGILQMLQVMVDVHFMVVVEVVLVRLLQV
jgi:hypothetical protein